MSNDSIDQRVEGLQALRERDRRALDILYNVSLACRGRTSFRTIFSATYRELKSIFSLDACYIAMCDAQRMDRFRAALLVDGEHEEFTEHDEYGVLTGILVRERRPLLFRDLLEERRQLTGEVLAFGDLQRRSRAWMGVPLKLGADAVGVISIQSYQPGLYSEDDLDLLQRVGNVVAAALENARLSQHQYELSTTLAQRVAARTQELAMLGALASELVLQRQLSQLLDRALGLIVPLIGLEGAVVRLINPQRTELLLVAQRGLPESYLQVASNIPIAGSSAGSVVLENRPLIVPSGLTQVAYAGGSQLYEAALVVPLRIGERVIGTLSLLSVSAREFDESHVDLAQLIANQIAIAVENSRLLEERERQIAELRVLSGIATSASVTSELPTLLRQVHETLRSFIRLDAFLMIVYDPARQIVTHGLGIDQGQEYDYLSDEPPPAGSLTGWVIRNRRVLHLHDVERDLAQYPELNQIIIGFNRVPASWLGVPLFDRQSQVIGIIGVQSYSIYAFSERDEQFLVNTARQIALHVQNIRLQNERERRIAKLNTVARISQHIGATFAMEEMIERIYEEILDVMDATMLYLALYDPRADLVTNLIYIEEGRRIDTNWQPRRPTAGSLTDWIIRQRRPLILHDLPLQRDELARMGITPVRYRDVSEPRAWIGVPLLEQDGRPIGVLAAQNYRAYSYDQQTLDFLIQITSHLSLGVQKVRLFAERERQVRENERLYVLEQEARQTADTLREVTRALSTSFDPDELLQLILRELQRVIPYDTASIMLIDGDLLRVAARRTIEGFRQSTLNVLPLNQHNAAAIMVRQREPLIIADTYDSPYWRRTPDTDHIRSWLGVPLIHKNEILGVLNISARHPERFSSRDAEVAAALAGQAAVALVNARLYQDSVTRVEQELEIARQIQSNLFPRSLPRLVGLELAATCLPARETGGDFYDMLLLRERILGLLVGDASGKSIPGAILMAVARSTARSEARDHETPQLVMRETNRLIADDVPAGAFVALSYATIDLDGRRLALSSAGQLAPLRRSRNGTVSYLEVVGPTLPLGIHPEIAYETLELPLAAGDMLLFYTDGIVEAHDRHSELFGFERLEQLLYEYGHLTPQALIEQILEAIRRFSGEVPQHDDMTLVALYIH